MAENREIGRGPAAEENQRFARLFGDAEGHFTFTGDNVREAIGRLRINGQSYAERYEIGEITDRNYQAAVHHVMDNITNGDIAKSYWNSEPDQVMQVLLLGRNPEDPVVTSLQPPSPLGVGRPESLSLWKQVMGIFGFYREEREAYQQQMEDYQKAQTSLRIYNENAFQAAREARAVEGRVREVCAVEPARKERVRAAFATRENRAALQEAARAVEGLRIPTADEAAERIRRYIPDYRPGMRSGLGLAGFDDPNRLLDMLRAYEAAEMTPEQLQDVTEEQRLAVGQRFAQVFKLAQAPADGAQAAEPPAATDEEKDAAAEAVARMYTRFTEGKVPRLDAADPESIRANGNGIVRMSRTASTLHSLMGGGEHPDPEFAARIARRLPQNADIVESLNRLQAVYGYCQQAWSAMRVYDQEGFVGQPDGGALNAEAANRDMLRQGGNFLLFGDRLHVFGDMEIGAIPDRAAGLVNEVMTASGDSPEDMARLFNGRPAETMGAVSPEFIAATAARLPRNVLNGQYQQQLAQQAAAELERTEAAEAVRRQQQEELRQQQEAANRPQGQPELNGPQGPAQNGLQNGQQQNGQPGPQAQGGQNGVQQGQPGQNGQPQAQGGQNGAQQGQPGQNGQQPNGQPGPQAQGGQNGQPQAQGGQNGAQQGQPGQNGQRQNGQPGPQAQGGQNGVQQGAGNPPQGAGNPQPAANEPDMSDWQIVTDDEIQAARMAERQGAGNPQPAANEPDMSDWQIVTDDEIQAARIAEQTANQAQQAQNRAGAENPGTDGDGLDMSEWDLVTDDDVLQARVDSLMAQNPADRTGRQDQTESAEERRRWELLHSVGLSRADWDAVKDLSEDEQNLYLQGLTRIRDGLMELGNNYLETFAQMRRGELSDSVEDDQGLRILWENNINAIRSQVYEALNLPEDLQEELKELPDREWMNRIGRLERQAALGQPITKENDLSELEGEDFENGLKDFRAEVARNKRTQEYNALGLNEFERAAMEMLDDASRRMSLDAARQAARQRAAAPQAPQAAAPQPAAPQAPQPGAPQEGAPQVPPQAPPQAGAPQAAAPQDPPQAAAPQGPPQAGAPQGPPQAGTPQAAAPQGAPQAGVLQAGAPQGPQPIGTAPGPQPTVTAPGPQPTGTAPGPQPTTAAPGPQPTVTAPGTQPTTTAPGPQPTTQAPPRTTTAPQERRTTPQAPQRQQAPGSLRMQALVNLISGPGNWSRERRELTDILTSDVRITTVAGRRQLCRELGVPKKTCDQIEEYYKDSQKKVYCGWLITAAVKAEKTRQSSHSTQKTFSELSMEENGNVPAEQNRRSASGAKNMKETDKSKSKQNGRTKS